MKRCSYCGRESGEDEGYCSGCGSPFTAAIGPERPRPIPKPVKEGECSYCGLENTEQAEFCSGCGSRLNPTFFEQENVASRRAPRAVDRDNSWSAKDAWKCLGMFVVFEFVIVVVWRAIGITLPGFRYFSGTGAGHLTYSLVHYAVQIPNVLYFARTETFQSFLRAFGLTTGPSRYAWFAAATALVIRGVSHLVITYGYSRGVTTTSLWGFTHSLGLERLLYVAPALMAPFGEELYMRGFFYRAFRRSYSLVVSTVLILAITTVTHWSQAHRSWIAAVGIGALTIVQCFLWERTGNLWDCIICHFAFSASGAFLSLRVN
jgi:membrane protease YdiL (CAAX protease family)